MEFGGQVPVDEMGIASGPPGAYGGTLPRTHAPAPASSSSGNGAEAAQREVVGYRECLRNHAAALGRNVVDGCGEFMPSAAGDEVNALSCAACSCHRSFHRKDDEQQRRLLLPPPPAPSSLTPLLLPPPHHLYSATHPHTPPFPYHHHHHHTPSVSGGTTTTELSSEKRGPPLSVHGQARRKWFRTRFTTVLG